MRATRLAAQVIVSTALVIPAVAVGAPIASAAPQVTDIVDTGSGSNSGSGSSSDVNTLVCQFSSAILQLLNPTQSVPRCSPPQSALAPPTK